MKYVGCKYPTKEVETFDDLIEGVYAHRSDALRDAMRDKIRDLEEQKRLRDAANDKAKM
jgi:metal-responsive CopG/Arc/MetJ family transcriptional regulator